MTPVCDKFMLSVCFADPPYASDTEESGMLNAFCTATPVVVSSETSDSLCKT